MRLKKKYKNSELKFKPKQSLFSEKIMKLIGEGRVKVYNSLKEFYDRKKKAKTF